ncbi:MAG: hypothetical protein RIS84_854, partial [Pseudomonadota bacterium]
VGAQFSTASTPSPPIVLTQTGDNASQALVNLVPVI